MTPPAPWLAFACPKCGARKGERCQSTSYLRGGFQLTIVHAARKRLAEAKKGSK